MNQITLKGFLRNIRPSHSINGVDYDKADLLVKRKDGKEDVLSIRFKKFSNPYSEDQEISLVGNVRSYSWRVDENKNKVDIYVFTYFDVPELDDNDQEIINKFEIDGRICKMEPLRTTNGGKQNIHFILANNVPKDKDGYRLNSYLPCIAWGSIAKSLEHCKVNDNLLIKGELHSREYTKRLSDTEVEIRVAHELVVTSFEVIEEEKHAV